MLHMVIIFYFSKSILVITLSVRIVLNNYVDYNDISSV